MTVPQPAGPQPTGPLAGIRVLDLTQFVLGPFATQTLGDLGADIIKIEEPGGDRQRKGTGKTAPDAEMGPLFIEINRNKRSVVLDLKSPDGQAELRELVKTADVFIHNMRPDSIQRLGFDYARVKALKPDIVYVVAMGFGSDGPYAGLQAFDDLIQAASGACDLLPYYDGDPALRPMPSIIADKTCGLYAVIATQAALVHRARTGEGQYVEVPMLETFTGYILAEHLNGHAYVPSRGKWAHPTTVTPHRRPYKTKDGYLCILPASQDASNRFLSLAGIEDIYNSPEYLAAKDGKARVDIYYGFMSRAAETKTTAEWMALCKEANIPAMRANKLEEVFEDPHFKATGFFEERELPGAGTYLSMRPGLRFSSTPCAVTRDPPRIGQHTEEVLGEMRAKAAE